jgi:hypothetical protein
MCVYVRTWELGKIRQGQTPIADTVDFVDYYFNKIKAMPVVLWPVVVVDSSTEARRGFRTVLLLNKGRRVHTVQRVPPGAIVGLKGPKFD